MRTGAFYQRYYSKQWSVFSIGDHSTFLATPYAHLEHSRTRLSSLGAKTPVKFNDFLAIFLTLFAEIHFLSAKRITAHFSICYSFSVFANTSIY